MAVRLSAFRIKEKLLFVSILLWMGNISLAQSENEKNFFKRAIRKTAESYRQDSDFYKAYLFFKKNEWDSVIVHSMKQLGKKTELDAYCHFFRGISLREKKLFPEARKEFLLIPRHFEFYSIVITYLGEIALEQSGYAEALHFFKVAEKQPGINYFKESSLYHNIGLCYFHLNEFEKAEPYLKKGLKIQEKNHDSLLLIGSYMDLANLYYEQFKDRQAIPYFEKAYRLSGQVKNFELKQNAALNMAVVEENRKNLPLALKYRKEYESWKDSLNDQNKVWAIAETEKKYIVGQKQKEISLLRAKNKIRETQRNGLFYSSLLLLALFGTGVYFYRQKIKSNKIILTQKIALDKLNAAKDRLFSIVSHDLRSSVNALKNSNHTLSQHLELKNYSELDKQLHHNSRIANGTYTLLENLLNWAMLQTKQSYFYCESQRISGVVEQVLYSYTPLMLEKNIHFENKIPTGALVFADLDSLKIIFRNLLDNAIKFSNPEGKILIYIQNMGQHFCEIALEDNGIGMDAETLDRLLIDSFSIAQSHKKGNQRAGLGMQLCKLLIQKNGGKFTIESTSGAGTKIIVSLPINA